MKENEIIKLFFKKQQNDTYHLNQKFLITTDSLVEETHFKLSWSRASEIASKLVEVNVSDIASSGGAKKGYALLNLGLNFEKTSKEWLMEFSRTLKYKLKIYNHELIGGDTYYSKLIHLNLTLISENEISIDRNHSKVGDQIFISGSVGLSNLGYKILKKEIKLDSKKMLKNSISKHLSPKSKFFEIQEILKKNKIHSMMDITDGLVQDLKKMTSGLKIDFHINLNLLPEFEKLKKILSIDEIICSGEELELICTTNENLNPFYKIGEVKKGNGKVHFYLDGKIYFPKKIGFTHFKI